MDWMVKGSNPGGARFSAPFQASPGRPPILLYNEYQVSLPEVKQLRHDV